MAASPSLLWSAEIPSLGVVSQVAVAADLAAVSTGSWLSIYDRQGALKGRWRNPSFSRLSAPTAGPNGRFYVASNIAAAVDGDGKELWTLPLRRDDVFRRPESKPFVMSPEGVLYSLQPDGVLVAIPAAVGYPVYRKPITTADYWDVNPLRITGGVGSWLVLSGVPTRGFMIADAKNGDVLWQVTHPEAKADNIAFLGAWSVIRGLGVWVADLNPSRQRRRGLWGWIGETQPSLELRWDVAVEPESFLELELVDHRGNLVFIEGSQPRGAGGRERFITMGCDGRTITEAPLDPGPSAYFTAFALGADGLVYGLTRNRYNNAEGVKLVVFDRSLRPLRTHEFKDARLGNLGEPSLVISKDGILYLALEAKDGTGRLHAIQTTSPGLAATPLSTFRHDAAGTGWTVSR